MSIDATMTKRWTGLLALLVAGTLAGLSALGQEPAAATSQPVSEPRPINPVNMIAESDLAARELLRVETYLTDSTVLESTRKRLEQLTQRQEKLLANPWGSEPEKLSSRARDMYMDVWRQVVLEWTAWSDLLDRRMSDLQANRERVRDMLETWTLTLKQGTDAGMTKVLRERAGAVIESCRRVDKLYLERLAALSELHARAAADIQAAKGLLKRFEAQDKQELQNLLSVDSPPLWRAFGEVQDEAAVSQDFLRSLEFQITDTAPLDVHGRVMVRTLGLLAVSLLVFVILSRRSQAWFSKPGMERAMQLFSTPVSAALLVTLLYFDMLVPTRMLDVRGIAIALLTLRVLHRILTPRTRKILYQSVALYILMEATVLIRDFSLLERLYVLVVSGLVLWFLMSFGRKLRSPDWGEGGWWLAARYLVNLMVPVVLVGVVANILGNQSLSYLLVSGVVSTIFLGIVIATAVFILETLSTSTLHIPRVAESRLVSRNGNVIERRLSRGFRLLGTVSFVFVALSTFKILALVEHRLTAILTYRVQVGNLDVSAWDVILFVLTLYVSILLSRFIRFVLEEEIYERVAMPRGLPNTVSMLVNYGILALGFFVAISVAGLDLGKFAILAGALGVGIGFGLQNVVNNFVSGIILAFERPIQVGDTVEVGQLIGRVKRIGFRSSTVRTYEGAEVIVPNGNLISSEVVNWTLSDRLRRIDIAVGVAYGSDPEHVLAILEAAVTAHSEILAHPPCSVIFVGFGESSLDFSARVWTAEFEDWLRIRSELSVRIYRALADAGIEIPFPQRDLHLRSISPGVRLPSAPGAAGEAPA